MGPLLIRATDRFPELINIFTLNMEDMKTHIFSGCKERSTGEYLQTIRKIAMPLYSVFSGPIYPGRFNAEDESITILRIVRVCSPVVKE